MESFTPLQWEMLGLVHDDNFGFWELALGEQRDEAKAALLDLYNRGYVEILDYEWDEPTQFRLVENAADARAVIQSDENWRTPLERQRKRMFTAFMTPEGLQAAERFADHAEPSEVLRKKPQQARRRAAARRRV